MDRSGEVGMCRVPISPSQNARGEPMEAWAQRPRIRCDKGRVRKPWERSSLALPLPRGCSGTSPSGSNARRENRVWPGAWQGRFCSNE